MADVSIYVALIAAFAGVTGAAIPQIAIVVRDVRQSAQDRQDHYDDAVRQACCDNTNWGLGDLIRPPDLRALDDRVGEFRDQIIASAQQRPVTAVRGGSPGTGAEPAPDDAAKAPDP